MAGSAVGPNAPAPCDGRAGFGFLVHAGAPRKPPSLTALWRRVLRTITAWNFAASPRGWLASATEVGGSWQCAVPTITEGDSLQRRQVDGWRLPPKLVA